MHTLTFIWQQLDLFYRPQPNPYRHFAYTTLYRKHKIFASREMATVQSMKNFYNLLQHEIHYAISKMLYLYHEIYSRGSVQLILLTPIRKKRT
jgi:hypothetical protein